ncbi:hypothetical protein TSUD_305340 [Trifolium subterraneum]|uniref:Uncharacterized protein n=1 Tax=Trifolium subterraneum TaxID=3900 RepID=A0A2Z6PC82_TRISU|nr:hypothetical protein TSUD_305340 [Trifolium subterraneum]
MEKHQVRDGEEETNLRFATEKARRKLDGEGSRQRKLRITTMMKRKTMEKARWRRIGDGARPAMEQRSATGLDR